MLGLLKSAYLTIMVITYSEVIQGKNTMHLLFGDLSRGLYTIVVTLGSNIYIGIVDII